MNRFVVVDLETTGNKAKTEDRIIQIGAVLIEGREITQYFSTFVQPKRSIPSFISELTGITETQVKDAPLFKEAVRPFVEMCQGACIVAHNSAFDLSFLQEEYIRNGIATFNGPVIDTVELARFLFPTVQSYSLQSLAKELNIVHESPHRADEDAKVTAKIFQKMLMKLGSLPEETLELLANLAFYLKTDIQQLIQTILMKKPNKEIKEDYILYNGIWLKPYKPKDRKSNHTENLEESVPSKIVTTICQAWEKKKQFFLEVNTTSKEFIENLAITTDDQFNEPLWIVSREPKKWEDNWQEEKSKVSVATLKGKHHYLSLKKFVMSLNEQDANYDHVLTKMQVLVWLLETTSGDVDELNLSSSSEDYWMKVSVDSRELKDSIGPDFSFYHRTLLKVSEASIIITNYPMLLSDALSKGSNIMKPMYCVLDEPETLVELMPKFFGKKLTFVSFRIWLKNLEGGKDHHFFNRLIGVDKSNSIPFELTIKDFVEKLREESEEFFQLAADYALLHEEPIGGFSPYVSAPIQPSHTMDSILYAGERLFMTLKELLVILTKRMNKQLGIETSDLYEQLLADWSLFHQETEEMIETLQTFLSPHQTEVTKWIETDTRGMSHYTAILSRPLLASNQLGQFLIDQEICALFLSSSLTVNRSFLFSTRSFGLTMNQIQSIQESTENKNSIFVADNKFNSKEIAKFAEKICRDFDKVFVLTGSFDETQAITDALQQSQKLEGFVLLSQSQASIGRLLKQMNRFDKAIYVGSQFSTNYTSAPETIEAFIITRLPFLAPNDLFHKLQAQKCEREGRNAFYSFSLPYAVIRLKRLFSKINFENNQIYLMDSRIWKSEYGKIFIQSIDTVKWIQRTLDE